MTGSGGKIAIAWGTVAAIAPSATPSTAPASDFAVAIGVWFAALRTGPGRKALIRGRTLWRKLAASRLREARRLIVRGFASLR